jgi:anti-sigma B factor antagonist
VNLTIGVRTSAHIRIVDVVGEIDVYTSVLVKTALLEIIDDGHRTLLVNLGKVRHIDSTGLGVFVGALRRVRTNGGRLDLICADPLIRKLFDITGLAKAFTIFRDERTAIVTLSPVAGRALEVR